MPLWHLDAASSAVAPPASAPLVLGNFLGCPKIYHGQPGSSQGSGGRSEPLAKPQRPHGRSDCALELVWTGTRFLRRVSAGKGMQ